MLTDRYYENLKLTSNPAAAATLVLAEILLVLLDELDVSNDPGPAPAQSKEANATVHATINGEPIQVEIG